VSVTRCLGCSGAGCNCCKGTAQSRHLNIIEVGYSQTTQRHSVIVAKVQPMKVVVEQHKVIASV
jgi:hypothetical protein